MGLQVPFAPYLQVFFFFCFFVTVTIYLERLRPIKLRKQNNKTINDWEHLQRIYLENHGVQKFDIRIYELILTQILVKRGLNGLKADTPLKLCECSYFVRSH